MKKGFIVFMAAFFFSCDSGEKETADTSEKGSMNSMPMEMSGYAPTYSASFDMGDSKQAEAVLKLWKDWENGDLTPAKSHFADSVTFYSADGSLIQGSLDDAFSSMQAYRNSFSSIGTVIHAIFPIKSTDKNENWVCVWGTEYQTDKNGKLDSVTLQETWRFNNNGKIDLMYQYMRPAASAPPPPSN